MKPGILATLAAAIALAGCSTTGDGAPASSFYECGGTRLKVDFLEGKAVVQMNDDPPVTIPADPSASGAKYMSPTHQFWDKGNEAMWTVGRMAPTTCNKVMMPGAM